MKRSPGRPPKPAHLKILAGTHRADRDLGKGRGKNTKARPAAKGMPKRPKAAARLREVPPPPPGLPRSLRRSWATWAAILIGLHALTESRLGLLALFISLEKAITASAQRGEIVRPSVISQLLRLRDRLGLDVAATGKAPSAERVSTTPAPPHLSRGNRFHKNWTRAFGPAPTRAANDER